MGITNIKIKFIIQDSPSITFGNQKWKGAIPVLSISVENKIIFISFIEFKKKNHS